MSKTKTMYTVRYETTSGRLLGRTVGFKQRLLDRVSADRVIKRLRRSGVDAYRAPVAIARKSA